jgi:hypothetical protein
MAGHVGLELGNVISNYPFERSRRFPGSQPNSSHGDPSRLSCGAGDTLSATRRDLCDAALSFFRAVEIGPPFNFIMNTIQSGRCFMLVSCDDSSGEPCISWLSTAAYCFDLCCSTPHFSLLSGLPRRSCRPFLRNVGSGPKNAGSCSVRQPRCDWFAVPSPGVSPIGSSSFDQNLPSDNKPRLLRRTRDRLQKRLNEKLMMAQTRLGTRARGLWE